MSETQQEPDTDTGPTPGPWTVEQGTVISESERGHIKHVANLLASHPAALDECDANARLIAAAGTAAQEAKEMGYDPVAAVKLMPRLLRIVDALPRGMVREKFTRVTTTSDVESLIESLNDALDRAEGSGDE